MGVDDKVFCEKCGSEMVIKRQGSTQGLYCTNCDWAVVTTYVPDIVKDSTVYEVQLTKADFGNKQHLKVLADVLNVNLLQARNIAKESSGVIFKGAAVDVDEVKKKLESVDIEYEIAPDFPY